MLVQIDTRRRVTLPAVAGIRPGDALELEVLDDGRVMLIPVEAVPRHQLWAWTAETKQAVAASLSDPTPSIVVKTKTQADKLALRWSREG